MARTESGFRWDSDKIRPSLKTGEQKARAYLSRITNYHALRAEAYMKIQARWTDRTGNARQGLVAEADTSRSRNWHYEIILSHSVNYGIWLEVRFGGRFAIIRPTMQNQAPEYWETAREVLDVMFGKGLV